MEQIIAKLVHEFEDGFVNRRQLVQNLALVFTAALSGKAYAHTPVARPVGTRESPFRTVELDNISYQVSDYRVTRDFYADLMGMEVRNDNGKTQCELYFGRSMLLARNRPQPRDTEGAAATLPPAATGQAGTRLAPTSFVDHISYRIFNWETDQVREELIRRKRLTATVQPDTGGGPGYSSFHVSDPGSISRSADGLAPRIRSRKRSNREQVTRCLR